MTTAALFALAWLLSGLLVARCMPRTYWEDGMQFNLLDRKIAVLEAKTVDGQITAEMRTAITRALHHHAHVIVAMEELLRAAPEVTVRGAHLIAAVHAAPELQVMVTQGSLSTWRTLLADLGFAETGIADMGLSFRGAFVVHLTYGATEVAEAVAA